MNTQAYLIDPFEQQINKVNLDGSLDTIYRHMQCRVFDAVRLKTGEVIYVDDEGLLMEPTQQAFFALPKWSPAVLAGRALWIGTDSEGGDTDPTTNIDIVRSLIVWIS